MKTVFTIPEVAKLCKVTERTALEWFDLGQLRGYRVPSTRSIRIPRERLIQFLKEHGMPLGELEEESKKNILLIGVEESVQKSLHELLCPKTYELTCCKDSYEAGIQADNLHPECFVLDFAIGHDKAVLASQNIRNNANYEGAILLGILPEEIQGINFDSTPFALLFRKPLDINALVDLIQELMREKESSG